jgi:predicted PurR-regulated permease PerM
MQLTPEARRQRVLVVSVIIALLFGAYFLRPYFTVIVFALIMAHVFYPIHRGLTRRLHREGASAALTFFISLFIVVIPAALLLFLTVMQAENVIRSLTSDNGQTISNLAGRTLDHTNALLAQLPGNYHITHQHVLNAVNHLASSVAQGILGVIRSSVSSIATFIVTAVIYVYLFVNILRHRGTLITTVRRLNPLGDKATGMYLHKMGAMTTAMVRGQFIIAASQGFVGALILHFAGLHNVFFFMFMLLTLLSIIPLGAGVVMMPAGLYFLFTGHIITGALVLLAHFIIITNIDNVLRPYLVPKDARLNSALTILSVFAGVAMFGFLGVVIGPVIMIMITATIQMYLAERGKTAIAVTAAAATEKA